MLGFVWFLPEEVPAPTRLEALREPLRALLMAPGDGSLGEGRARALIKERLGSQRLTPDEFQEAWRSSEPVIRWAAWLVVGDYGIPDAPLFAALRTNLASDQPAPVRAVCASAALAMAAYLDAGLRPTIERAVGDTEGRVRAPALQVLGQMAPADPGVWSTLATALSDEEGACRDAGAAALARIPFGDLTATVALPDDVVPALRVATRDKRETVQMYATMALGRMGPRASEAVPDLLRLLEGDAALLQGHAATALGRIGAPALPALAQAVREVPPQQIPMVLWALRLVGAPAQSTLRDVMQNHANDAVRVVAALKLWELQQPIDTLIPAFVAALQRGSLEAQLQAARGAQRIGAPAAALLPQLRAAQKRLGSTGTDPKTLRRALVDAIESVTP